MLTAVKSYSFSFLLLLTHFASWWLRTAAANAFWSLEGYSGGKETVLSLVLVSLVFPTATRMSRGIVSSASLCAEDCRGDIFILAQIFLFIVCLKLIRGLLVLPSDSSDTGARPEVC